MPVTLEPDRAVNTLTPPAPIETLPWMLPALMKVLPGAPGMIGPCRATRPMIVPSLVIFTWPPP